MKQTFSIRDLELLGYMDAKDVTPKKNEQYRVYSASVMAGIKQITHNFVYLKSSCTKADINKIPSIIKDSDNIYIIKPKSLGIRDASLKEILPRNVKIYIYEELIWDRLQSFFSGYIDQLQTTIAIEKYYVPPRKENCDPKEHLDDEILDFLIGKRDLSSNLLIVSASAGVGKTTLSRHLSVELSKKSKNYRIIPAFVESQHWRKLNIGSIDELWEVIENSIRNFSPNLRISEQLFEHCLKNGNLVFIFDGFDELCGHRDSQFSPNDILQKLSEISKESNAKIILTTRTLYWESEIKEPPDNVKILKLAPFNTQQAKGYYQKFFAKDKSMRDRAMNMYRQLIESNIPPTIGGARVQFVNLPLCVGMIAEYVNIGGTGDLTPQSGKGIIRDVLYQICDREKKRQNLLTNAEDQLNAFELISVDQFDMSMPEFDIELLAIAGFDETDIPRLISHPLLTTENRKTYRFNYEFLPQYLRAFYISKIILSKKTCEVSDIWRIMCREANGKGHLFEHMLAIISEDDISKIESCVTDIPSKFKEASSFLFHLSKQIIDRSNLFVTKEEKTVAIFSVFNKTFNKDNQIKNIHIIGNIENLNFEGITFSNCRFTDNKIIKCDAGASTIFTNCIFSGELDFLNCNKGKWGQVQLIKCSLHPPTNLVWQEIRGESYGPKKNHIMDALQLALNKFWYNGRLKMTIKKDDWAKGSLGHSIYCQTIRSAMLKHGLISEVKISGVSEGGYSFLREAISDLQRFMDNRQLTGRLRDVFNSLLNS